MFISSDVELRQLALSAYSIIIATQESQKHRFTIMIKNGAGRRQESVVWLHFSYDAVANRTTCIVADGEGKRCNTELTGKNPTNMKAHLSRAHKDVYDVCIKKDIALREEKKVKTATTVVPASATQTHTIASMFGNHSKSYPPQSNEQLAREQDFTDWFIETGLPYRIIDGPAFRKIFRRMDPKFTVPGENCIFIEK